MRVRTAAEEARRAEIPGRMNGQFICRWWHILALCICAHPSICSLAHYLYWWTHAFCLNESCLLRTVQWAKQAKQPAGMAAALHQDFGLTNQPVLVSLWYFILAESKAPLTSVWVSRPATNLSAQFADKLPKEWLCHSCRKMFSSLKCNVAEYKPVFLV